MWQRHTAAQADSWLSGKHDIMEEGVNSRGWHLDPTEGPSFQAPAVKRGGKNIR